LTVSRKDFEDAVAAYWGTKRAQKELSAIKNKVGAGTAGSVRSGKHFDTIAALLAKFFLEAGYPPDAIRVTKSQGLNFLATTAHRSSGTSLWRTRTPL
jgi:hypothetical protein